MASIVGTAVQRSGLVIILIETQTYFVAAFPFTRPLHLRRETMVRSISGAVTPLVGLPLYRGSDLG